MEPYKTNPVQVSLAVKVDSAFGSCINPQAIEIGATLRLLTINVGLVAIGAMAFTKKGHI